MYSHLVTKIFLFKDIFVLFFEPKFIRFGSRIRPINDEHKFGFGEEIFQCRYYFVCITKRNEEINDNLCLHEYTSRFFSLNFPYISKSTYGQKDF